MKHLGITETGGSLDITTNKHVEELLEGAFGGIEFPEDTDTTYTLTQDGMVVQVVDDLGEVVSEVDLAPLIPQPVDPYQEVIGIAVPPPVNLFDILGGRYGDFIVRSEFDEESNRISIRLHLEVGGSLIDFTIANDVSNQWDYYNRDGDIRGSIDLVDVRKYTDGAVVMIGENTEDRVIPDTHGGGSGILLMNAAVQPTADSPLSNHSDGIAIYDTDRYMVDGRIGIFVFPDVNEESVSDYEIITATLEEHLQGIYESIHGV